MTLQNDAKITDRFEVRNIRSEETDQAIKIEQICFPANEACSPVFLLGLDVLPEYRRQGLAREIVRQYHLMAEKNGKKKLILTCLPEKVLMYEKFGFTDNGICVSTWGGEQWHEMILE